MFIAPALPLRPALRADGGATTFDEPLDTDEGWAKYNRHYWLARLPGFLEFFFAQMFTEPHSTKQIEDCVGWGLETTPRRWSRTQLGTERSDDADERARRCADRVRCPVLVIHGDDDAITPARAGAALAERDRRRARRRSRARATARTPATR